MTRPAGVARGRRGMVLLVVLFFIVLLAVIVTQFQFTMKIERRIARYRADSLAAAYTLRSAVELTRLAIAADVPVSPPDALAAAPGTAAPPPMADAPADGPLPSGALPASIGLADAAGHLDLSRLVRPDGTPDPDIQRALENLITGLGGDPGLVENIIDFIDPDDKGTRETEACLNRPLQNITELALVPGLDRELLRPAPGPDGTARPGLLDLLSLYGQGRINVNTAHAEVLYALLANPAFEPAVAAIIEQRRETPFTSLQEVFLVAGAAPGMFGNLEKQLVFKSTVFIATLTAREGTAVRTAIAVFERGAKEVGMLLYFEE
ncbi:MAG: type II secretion system protein GspK [Planctomycetota bacterium]